LLRRFDSKCLGWNSKSCGRFGITGKLPIALRNFSLRSSLPIEIGACWCESLGLGIGIMVEQPQSANTLGMAEEFVCSDRKTQKAKKKAKKSEKNIENRVFPGSCSHGTRRF